MKKQDVSCGSMGQGLMTGTGKCSSDAIRSRLWRLQALAASVSQAFSAATNARLFTPDTHFSAQVTKPFGYSEPSLTLKWYINMASAISQQ